MNLLEWMERNISSKDIDSIPISMGSNWNIWIELYNKWNKKSLVGLNSQMDVPKRVSESEYVLTDIT